MNIFFALTHPSGGVWLESAFNQEKALVGAFSVITILRMELFGALQETVDKTQFSWCKAELDCKCQDTFNNTYTCLR